MLAAARSFTEGGVGMMLLMAASGKLSDRRAFIDTVAAYRILPGSAPYSLFQATSAGLILAELAIGAGLLASMRVASFGAVALFLVFAAAIALNMLRGRTEIDCGCATAGTATRISWPLSLRAAVLAAVMLAVAMTHGTASTSDVFVLRAVGAGLWVCIVSAGLLRAPAVAGGVAR